MWIKVWNRLASAYDSDIRDLKFDLLNKSFYRYDGNIIEKINLVINIAVASVCIFLIKVPLWQLPLIIIGFDFFFTFVNTTIVNHIEKRYDAVLNGYKAEKYLSKLKEQRDFYKSKCKSCSGCEYYYNVCRRGTSFEKRISVLDETIKKIESKIETVVTKDVIKDTKENKQLDAIKSYKNVILNLKKERFDYLSQIHQKNINESIKITEALLLEVEKNPSAYRIVQNTFEIYIIELVNTIVSINKLDDGFKKEYQDKISNLVLEYNGHVERLLDRVKKYNLTNIDVNINTLLKEMKNDE